MATAIENGRTKTKPVVEIDEGITTIEIPEIEMESVTLLLTGVTPLIMHRWSEKAVKKLEDTQTGKATQKNPPKVPEEEWCDAAYVIPGREDLEDWKPGKYNFPASAFKHAYLYGVAQLEDKRVPKTRATGWVFPGDDPELMFESVTLRRDIGRKPVQMLYRPQFNGWSCELDVDYDRRCITEEQVISLFNAGGFKGGVGEWRPSAPINKSGSFGRFRVTSASGNR